MPDPERAQEAARPRRDQARHRPAPARRGPDATQWQGPRRHPLPLRHRRARQPQRRAVRGGREAVAGHERQPAREAVLVMSVRRRTTTRVTVELDRGVFMISVAAELADMHPQTLRMYEARGLIEPKRSPKGTRLYSQADVERLRRIQEMTTDLGLNLAGVERVLDLEEQLERASRRLEALERRSAEMRAEMEAEIERVRKSFKAELVPYKGADHRPHPRRRRPPAAAVDPGRARHVARSAACVGGAPCAYCIGEGKRTRGGATVRGRPRGRERLPPRERRLCHAWWDKLVVRRELPAMRAEVVVRRVRAPAEPPALRPPRPRVPSVMLLGAAPRRRPPRRPGPQVLPRVVPPSPPASSSAA